MDSAKNIGFLFLDLTDISIKAAQETAQQGDEADKIMAAAYMMAIHECRKLLLRIIKDVE